MVEIGNKGIVALVAILIAAFFFALFGLAGLKTITAVFLFFFLPFYLILDNFDLELGEKVVFSFFIGIGLFSAFVYYIGFLFGSIKMAVAVTFVFLIVISILLRKFKTNSANP